MKESSFELDLNESEASLNLGKLIKRLFRFWPWLLGSLLFFLVLGYMYLRYAPITYESVARIKVVEDSQETEIAKDPTSKAWSDSKVNTDNETAILKSYRLLSLVVDSLDLNVVYSKVGSIKSTEIWQAPFYVSTFANMDSIKKARTYTVELKESGFKVVDEEENETAIPYFDTRLEFMNLPFVIALREDSMIADYTDEKFEVTLNPFKQSVIALAKNLNIETISKKSDVLELTLLGENPSKSEAILNTIIHEFNQDGIRDRQQVSRRTLAFIDERFEYLTRELDSIEGGKQDFKQENNLSYIEADAGNSLVRKSETENEVSEIQTQISLASVLKKTVLSQKEYSLLPVNIGLENPSLNATVNNYNVMALEREKLLASVSESHPTLTTLSGQLERAKKNILSTVNVYQTQLKTSLRRLNEEKNKANTVFSSLPEKEKMLRSIERQQSIKENLFLLLLQRREEAAINLAVTSPSVKVVDYGLTAIKPVAPKKMIVIGISGIMGLFLPLLILYIKLMANGKIVDRSDFKDGSPDFPLLAEIPHFKKEKRFKDINEQSVLAETYRILATKIDVKVHGETAPGGKVVFCTSSTRNEGKTTTAYNLSVAYASLNKKVLLIDANLRNPEIHGQLGVSAKTKGLSEYLQGSMLDWKETISRGLANCNRHEVCLAGKVPENAPQLLSKNMFGDYIAQAKQVYDMIIVDTAPVTEVTDTLLIAKHADLMLYIMRSGVTDLAGIASAKDLKISHKLKDTVFVLNDIS